MIERAWVLGLGSYAALVGLAPTAGARLALAAPVAILPVAWWTLAAPARWVSSFLLAAVLLPPLPIALGDSGPHPALLFALLGVFAYASRFDALRIEANFLTGSLLALLAALLLSLPFAALYSGAEIAAASMLRVALFAISLAVFAWTAYGPEQAFLSVRVMFGAATVSALFGCIDFYFQWPAPAGYGPQFVWLASGVYRRAQGLFYEASTLGNFCVFFLVMVVVALVQGAKKITTVSRPVLIGGATIILVALIFSYSRASLLNLAVAMMSLALLNRRRIHVRRAAGVTLLALSVAVLAAHAAFPAFVESYWLRLSGSFVYFLQYTEDVLSGRLESWRTLLTFLADHPWSAIFGVGYKTLPYSDIAGRPVIADNMYLSLLVETGWVGLTALVAASLAILRAGWQSARSDRAEAAFFGTWIFCFWTGQMVQMLSGDLLTYWRVLPLYFWVLARAVRISA